MKLYQKIKRKCTQVSRAKRLRTSVKLPVTLGLLLTAAMLVMLSLSSFFSDYTSGDVTTDLKIPNKLQIRNLELDTHTGIKTDPTEVDSVTGDITHEGNELVTFDHFVLSDVVTLSFDLTNIGNEELTVKNSVLKLAWDYASTPKDVKGYVYVYPASMTDDAIRTNINAGGTQALTKDLMDSPITMNDGTPATGLTSPFATSALSKAGESGDAKNYAFKVVYARDNDVQTHADFLPFNGQNLKIDLYTEGKTARYTIIRDYAQAVLTAETMPMMMATSGSVAGQIFWGFPSQTPTTKNVTKQQVEKIQFVDLDVKTTPVAVNGTWNSETVVYAWDVSVAKDGTVQAWLTAVRGFTIDGGTGLPVVTASTRYNLYVGGQNGVLANAGAGNGHFANFNAAKTIDVTQLEVCESTNLSAMFLTTTALQSLIGYQDWHTRNNTSTVEMFRGAGTTAPGITALDLSGWDVDKVTDMTLMFYQANKLKTLNATGWAPGLNATASNLSQMFREASSLQQVIGIADWDTTKVTNLFRMFQSAGTTAPGLTTLDLHTHGTSWDVSNVTTMSYMFNNANKLVSLDTTGWKIGTNKTNVTLDNMFGNAVSLTTITGSETWDTSKVINMSNMFDSTTALPTVVGIKNWDVANVTTMASMFYASGITTLDISGWNAAKVTTMVTMFYQAASLTVLDAVGLAPGSGTATSATNLQQMFDGTTVLRSVTGIEDWDVSKVANISYMFRNSGRTAPGLTTLDLHKWNVANVTTTQNMFNGANRMTTLNLSDWNLGKVTTMVNMFANATALTTVDATGWNPGALTATAGTTMTTMFQNTTALTNVIGITNWNVSKVTSMSNMFADSMKTTSTTLDLTGWDVSNVTAMNLMFCRATKLTAVDTTGWNTGKLANMQQMFDGATTLASIPGIENWNTAAATNMSYVFRDAKGLITLNLRGWNTAAVTTMIYMFNGTTALTALDMRTAVFTKAATAYTNMFTGSNNASLTMIVKDSTAINDLTVRLDLNPRPATIVTP